MASPLRRVEREIVRGRLTVRQSCGRIHQRLAVIAYFIQLHIVNHHDALALLHGIGHSILEPLPVFGIDFQLIDHQFYAMILVTVEFHSKHYLADFAVDPYSQIAFLAQLLEKFLIMSFAVIDQRRKNHSLTSRILVKNQIDNLLLGVFHHLHAAPVRDGLAYPRKQEPQEVVHLGDCPYRTARILVDRLLLYGYYRAKPLDFVDIRTLQAAKHIARVG